MSNILLFSYKLFHFILTIKNVFIFLNWKSDCHHVWFYTLYMLWANAFRFNQSCVLHELLKKSHFQLFIIWLEWIELNFNEFIPSRIYSLRCGEQTKIYVPQNTCLNMGRDRRNGCVRAWFGRWSDYRWFSNRTKKLNGGVLNEKKKRTDWFRIGCARVCWNGENIFIDWCMYEFLYIVQCTSSDMMWYILSSNMCELNLMRIRLINF